MDAVDDGVQGPGPGAATGVPAADPEPRAVYRAGKLAQRDLWLPPMDVSFEPGQAGRPTVLVMVSGYSRRIRALLLPSRRGPDLVVGHRRLLQGLSGVSRALVWDNEAAAVAPGGPEGRG